MQTTMDMKQRRAHRDEPQQQLSTRVPKALHHALRVAAIEHNTTLNEILIAALTAELARMEAAKT